MTLTAAGMRPDVRAAAAAAAAAAGTPHPPGTVDIVREDARSGLRLAGGVAAAGGVALATASAISGRGLLSSSPTAALVVGGGLALSGAGLLLGASAVPHRTVDAVATGIADRTTASRMAREHDGDVVVREAVDGTFALIEDLDAPSRGGAGSDGFRNDSPSIGIPLPIPSFPDFPLPSEPWTSPISEPWNPPVDDLWDQPTTPWPLPRDPMPSWPLDGVGGGTPDFGQF